LFLEESPGSEKKLSAVDRLNKNFGEQYVFERELGTGAFCTVYEALHRETGERIAVKVSPILTCR